MQFPFDTDTDGIEIHTIFERELHFAEKYADSLEKGASTFQHDGNIPQIDAELAALVWWQGAGDIFY